MLRKFLATATFIPLVMACAPLARAQEYNVSSEQSSLVDQTCTQVLGLMRGQTYFALCEASLSNILAARNEGQALAAGYAGCSHNGLVEGTAAFSTRPSQLPPRRNRFPSHSRAAPKPKPAKASMKCPLMCAGIASVMPAQSLGFCPGAPYLANVSPVSKAPLCPGRIDLG